MDDFNPSQLITLCAVFIGFHLLALPLFLWAMRSRQFSGREQREWNLDAAAPQESALPLPPVQTGPLNTKQRLMIGALSVMGAAMLGSVLLVLFTALHAAAHPAAGKGPF